MRQLGILLQVAACPSHLSFLLCDAPSLGVPSAIFQRFPGSAWPNQLSSTRPCSSAPLSGSLVSLLGRGASFFASAVILIDLSFFLTCPCSPSPA